MQTSDFASPVYVIRDKLAHGAGMAGDTITHAELVAGVALGDVAAFTALFSDFAPRVRAWLGRGMDPARADEITQEVMVRVWRNAARYDASRAAVSTWIFTIARNARIDALRATRFEVDEADACFVADPGEGPEVGARRAERDVQVADAIAALPEEQAEVLRGAYYDSLTLREIAEHQQIPLGTVKSRVRLAFQRLAVPLAPWRGSE